MNSRSAMSPSTKLKILFGIKIFFTCFTVIFANGTIFDKMSSEERRFFFGTTDDKIPEFELVKIVTTSRIKRTPDPTLTLNIKTLKTVITSTLHMVHDNYLIGRRSTSIWFATSDAGAFNKITYIPQPNILQHIGEFHFYQDIEKGSAITRFSDAEEGYIYSGILCEQYAIKSVPRRLLHGIVEPPKGHAIKMRSIDSKDHEIQDDDTGRLHVIFKIPDSDYKHYRHRRRAQYFLHPNFNLDFLSQSFNEENTIDEVKVVYPKLIVPVDYISVAGKNIVKIVKYFISYFNSVDMMYRQLNNPKVRLHITGFIIPMDANTMPYIRQYPGDLVSTDYVLNAVLKYFNTEWQRFPVDTYNAVMVITTKPVCGYVDGVCESIGGEATYASACPRSIYSYLERKYSVGSGIVMFDWIFGGVSLITHELGHVLGADHDGEDTSEDCSMTEGYMMAPGINLLNTLNWSNCSRKAFKKYLRSEDAECMHNPPIELPEAIINMEGAWLSLNGQCKNKNKYYEKACEVDSVSDICESYGCQQDYYCIDMLSGASRGTACGFGKYCINNKCMYI